MVEENRYVKIFQISCGTLIWVRFLPVKVDQILTGTVRTYIIEINFPFIPFLQSTLPFMTPEGNSSKDSVTEAILLEISTQLNFART